MNARRRRSGRLQESHHGENTTAPLTSSDLRAEVESWAERLRVAPLRVEVRPLKVKWASCSTRGRIILSRELLGAPERLRTYVIVHELLHLRVPNHGKLFRRLLRHYVPQAGAWPKRGLPACSLRAADG